VEHLEPRLLLSRSDVAPPGPEGSAPPAVLQVVDLNPAGTSAATGGAPGAATVPASSGASLFPSGTERLITGSNGSATYPIPGGSADVLVTLQILPSPSPGQWSLSVRDGAGRAIGSVTVPPGQRETAVEIQSPSGGASGPMTLTVAADSGPSGQAAGRYLLRIEAAGPSAVPGYATAAPDPSENDFFLIMAVPGANLLEESEPPTHSTGAPGQGHGTGTSLSVAGALAVAPPSGASDPIASRPTSGAGGRVLPARGSSAEEQAQAGGGDSGRSGPDQELAHAESRDGSEPLPLDRPLVDTPGGLPGAAEAREALAVRMSGRGRPALPGVPGGSIALSVALTAGFSVPNVLLLGWPRARRSRPERRLAVPRRAAD
jgi:hypothetical protein